MSLGYCSLSWFLSLARNLIICVFSLHQASLRIFWNRLARSSFQLNSINIVVTQFWIHQDFLKCYFIFIIIYKNPKKLRKRKIQKYIFLESTASFRQNRVHQVNTGQTMSTRVKNEFRAVSGQNRYF